MKKCMVILYTLLLFCLHVFAQNNTSPYSIIGVGDIQQNALDRSAGMAGAGTSLSSGKFMYYSNPASYAQLDEHFFSMEFTTRYKKINYQGNSVSLSNSSTADLSVERFALAIKLRPWLASSIGLMPFSTSNYSFYGTKTIEGTSTTAETYNEGTGGLNQAYIANAIRINKNLRAGIQTTFLFGNFTQKETLYTDALNITASPVVTTAQAYVGKMYFKAGLQYDLTLNKNFRLGIGATASNKTTLNANYYVTATEDTATLISQQSYKQNYFSLPSIYQGALSLQYKNKFTFAIDYQRQLWSSLQYQKYSYQLVNSNRYAAGFEYSKKIQTINNAVEKFYLQTGLYYSNSYLKINGQQLDDRGISFGAGFNAKRSVLGYQFSLDIGSRGTTKNNLIKENYVQGSITLVYRDFWFTKVKRYD